MRFARDTAGRQTVRIPINTPLYLKDVKIAGKVRAKGKTGHWRGSVGPIA